MKKLIYSATILSALLLAACGGDEEGTKDVEVEVNETETASTEPTQEELDAQLKSEAIALDFVKANGDEIVTDTKVKIVGEVTNISSDGIGGTFTVTTTENDGTGMYTVENFSTSTIEANSNVTVYGTYKGKDDLGFPTITATIIE